MKRVGSGVSTERLVLIPGTSIAYGTPARHLEMFAGHLWDTCRTLAGHLWDTNRVSSDRFSKSWSEFLAKEIN